MPPSTSASVIVNILISPCSAGSHSRTRRFRQPARSSQALRKWPWHVSVRALVLLGAGQAHRYSWLGPGKTSAHTDTYHGRFVKLVTNEQVVEIVEFETTDPALQGEMTITITLADVDGGTDILAVHDGLPPGTRPPTTRPAGAPRLRNSLRSVEGALLASARSLHSLRVMDWPSILQHAVNS